MPQNEKDNVIEMFYKLYRFPHLKVACERYNISLYKIRSSMVELDIFFNKKIFNLEKGVLIPTTFADELFLLIDKVVGVPKECISLERKPTKSCITIGCSAYTGSIIFPLIYQLNHNEDEIKTSIQHIDLTPYNKLSRDMLIHEGIDVVFDETPVIHPSFNVRKILREDMVILCNQSHPQFTHSITAKEFNEAAHAELECPSSEMKLLQAQLKEQFPARRIDFSSPSYLNLFSVVECTELLCIAPQFMYARIEQAFKLRILVPDFTPTFKPSPLYISYRKSLSKDRELEGIYKTLAKIR